MSEVPVTVFFDFTCPFSYLTLEALRRRVAAGGVELRARALERYPAPCALPSPREEEGWEAALLRAGALALPLRIPAFRPRTRKAHEAVAAAGERGLAHEMRSSILAAYWADERDIGRIDVLSALGGEVGVDPEDLRIELDIDRHRESVLRDGALAERLRIVRTPTLFVGTGPDAYVLVGAQGEEELETAISGFEF